MNSKEKRETNNDEIFFIGEVTASISHEIKNVLAVINETSGLIDDLLINADAVPDASRIRELNGKINKHSKRGNEITRRLNKFAHTLDGQPVSFEINDIILLIGNILNRPANLKRINIETELQDEQILLKKNLFQFEHLIFCYIMFLIELPFEKDCIKLQVELNENIPTVSISGNIFDKNNSLNINQILENNTYIQSANLLMKKLKSCAQYEKNEENIIIKLSFPI